MGQVHEQGLFSPALMQEIRQQFIYVDWDPYSDKRIYFDAASGSCRPKRIIEAMGMETCLPDQQGRDNPGSRHAVEVTAKGIDDLMIFFGAKSGQTIPGWSSSHVIYRITNAARLRPGHERRHHWAGLCVRPERTRQGYCQFCCTGRVKCRA